MDAPSENILELLYESCAGIETSCSWDRYLVHSVVATGTGVPSRATFMNSVGWNILPTRVKSTSCPHVNCARRGLVALRAQKGRKKDKYRSGASVTIKP